MLFPQLLFATCLVVSCLSHNDSGTITGIVFNGSNGNAPVPDAEVILQVQQDGTFIPLARAMTDPAGRFIFDELAFDDNTVFLVGANRDGVFHPGERVRLDQRHTAVDAKVTVFNAITDPSPLIALRHAITIRAEPNLLNVTETILISNPTSYCYVGGGEGNRPVTLRLRVPSDFEKVTFHKEFYGRRFALIDGILMTTIPWPPGERELTFTYILPIEKRQKVWQRPLDLPCDDVSITVVAMDSKSVTCNLPSPRTGKDGELLFEQHGVPLPAGHAIRVELGHFPLSFSAFGRWIALGILGALISGVILALLLRRRRPEDHLVPRIHHRRGTSHQVKIPCRPEGPLGWHS